MVRKFAAERDGLEMQIAHPGFVTTGGILWGVARCGNVIPGVRAMAPNVSRTEMAAAILDQLVRGFDKETLTNQDLWRIGQAAMRANGDSAHY